ncbi:FtsX-like permease family protein [Treponema primitia]|uniref:ABC transporter permease n=1 Tax=Treponema primitia TaxID=88058 RepID=UPI00398188AE
MSENVYLSAQSHYAGDITAVGYDRDFRRELHMNQEEIAAVTESAELSGLNPERVVKRTNLIDKGILYYNGAAVLHKYLIGVDWEIEADYFSRLNYMEPPRGPIEGDDSILLSSPVAQKFQARIGDSLILEGETKTGQKNTAVFIVAGIIEDTTIFGYYKAYISRRALNDLIGFEEEDCSTIGFFLDNRVAVEKKRIALTEELERHINTAPIVHDRDELSRELDGTWEGVKVFVLTIPVYLSEVAELLDAINILSYFLYGMMLLIILVSASVTYRLILHERTREIGTLRAIGFYEGDVGYILLMETVFLGIISIIAGFIFVRFFVWGVSFISFTWIHSFEIFMKDGRLTALFLPKTMLVNLGAVFCMLIIASILPVFRSSRAPLPVLLSGEAI